MTSTDPAAGTHEERPRISPAGRSALVLVAVFGIGAIAGFLEVAAADDRLRGFGPTLLILAALAAGGALGVRIASAGRGLTLVGGAVAAVAVWLLAQRSDPAVAAVLAALFGLGMLLGDPGPPLVPRRRALVTGLRRRPGLVAAAVAALTAMIVLRHVAPRHVVAIVTAVAALANATVDALARPRPAAPNLRRATTFGAVLVVATLAFTGYVGAETPSASWFGGGVTHGPTTGNEVALTFDDGPNVGATTRIMGILDAYGVKGTFFQVGKAVDAQPAITRALYEDGHLLGNHSYHHDQWRWLDPRYPELTRTQDAFRRVIGTCPVLYRPPHGDRTPLLARVVRDHHMHMVLWNASTPDWATDDASRVARDVLGQARPGAIIDLHDGLDGDPAADRSVVVRALPLILDGLRAKGLQPVRLDRLLGTSAYQAC